MEETEPRETNPLDARARRLSAALAGHLGDEQGARAHLTDVSPAVRAAAFGALVRLGCAGAADVAAAMRDRAPLVRRCVCELAPRLDDLDPSPLLADPDPSVVEAAAFACGEHGTTDAVPRLAVIATSHTDPLCRESAVAALGAIGADAGRSAILSALGDVAQIRRRAVIALAAFTGDDIEAALRRGLQDRDWQVRQAAEDMLDRNEPRERGA